MLVIVICSLMDKKSLRLKPTKNASFPTQFCFANISSMFSNRLVIPN